MAVVTMKSTVIEFLMAPLIKSLAEKYLSFGEKKGKKEGKIIREREGKRLVRGEKGESRAEKGRQEKDRGERRRIKRLFCVESETHFLVRR